MALSIFMFMVGGFFFGHGIARLVGYASSYGSMCAIPPDILQTEYADALTFGILACVILGAATSLFFAGWKDCYGR